LIRKTYGLGLFIEKIIDYFKNNKNDINVTDKNELEEIEHKIFKDINLTEFPTTFEKIFFYHVFKIGVLRNTTINQYDINYLESKSFIFCEEIKNSDKVFHDCSLFLPRSTSFMIFFFEQN
jgi:hypothetical protein